MASAPVTNPTRSSAGPVDCSPVCTASTVSLLPGVALVAVAVAFASILHGVARGIPMLVAAVLTGTLIGNGGLVTERSLPGLQFASKTLLRTGIVLLGLRLSVGDVLGLGAATLVVIVATVAVTFLACSG